MAAENPPPRAARGSSWSFQLATIAGIPIRIHATFVLLLAWIGASHWLAGRGFVAGLESVLLMCLVFGVVVIHELSHALVARRFGTRTRDILLLPIGGVATMEKIPRRPLEELLVAVAGPAVNVVLAVVFFAAAAATGAPLGIDVLLAPSGELLPRLAWINVFLAGFNLLPAFPMDGGRALRAVLASTMPRERATLVAARIGQALALMLGLLGLFANPFLVFIALFVWIGAAEEARQTEVDALLAGARARHAMMRDFQTLTPRSSLADAAALVLDGWQRDFPVVEDGVPRGVLTRSGLITALTRSHVGTPIQSAMARAFVTATPDAPIEDVLARMRDERAAIAMVVEDNALVGIITMENVLDLVEITAARRLEQQAHVAGRPLPA